MNEGTNRSYPRTVTTEAGEVELRLMGPADEAAVLAFAACLPEHDLLFLRRDITQPKVVAAWVREIEDGGITSLLALREGAIVGYTALVRDQLSWSPHVGELRVLVGPDLRGKGLGRQLVQESFAIALDLGLEKVVAQMTVDQTGAIAVFEDIGFRGEALLREHVRSRDGVKHDIVIMSHDVARFQAQMEAYGLTGAV
jgi:RimJ/RimL family protein N-acetyltransferase